MKLGDRIEICQGDITELEVDAIVNAANNDLQLGGGLAGAIRRKGGLRIQAECDQIGTIPVGGAAITSGGNLKTRHVIHAASMPLGGLTTAQLLRSSTAHALRIAAQTGLRTIALPAIGSGIGGFPINRCAEIMLEETAKHFEQPTSIEKVQFVLFDQAALAAFERAWAQVQTQEADSR